MRNASPWPVSYGVWVVAALIAFYVRYSGPSTDTGGAITIDGASFPSELKMSGISQQLTGGGTRTKYGVAKVYAVALYVDTAAAASSLKKFASPKPTKDQKFFQALVDGTYSRTLFLQMLRGVAVMPHRSRALLNVSSRPPRDLSHRTSPVSAPLHFCTSGRV